MSFLIGALLTGCIGETCYAEYISDEVVVHFDGVDWSEGDYELEYLGHAVHVRCLLTVPAEPGYQACEGDAYAEWALDTAGAPTSVTLVESGSGSRPLRPESFTLSLWQGDEAVAMDEYAPDYPEEECTYGLRTEVTLAAQ